VVEILCDMLNEIEEPLRLDSSNESLFTDWVGKVAVGKPDDQMVYDKPLDIDVSRASLTTLIGEFHDQGVAKWIVIRGQ
jgi:hypothetical protein